MANRTINWIRDQKAQSPDKPFFIYYAPGASHAPHHVPKEWADKYKGKFDQGWDKLREETFARQKKLGVIPADAKLTPRDPAFPAWDSTPAEQKKLYARQMEVYAGFQENCRPRDRPRRQVDRGPGHRGQHARSSTSGATTAPAWREPRPARSTR